MAKYGVWMLERLLLQYSETDGSSRGMRMFIQTAAQQLQQQNPQLQVVNQKRGGHPFVVAFYRNGRSKPVCVKNMTPKAIDEHIYWLRNSHGRNMDEKVISSRHLSRNPSIQGPWNVQTFEQQNSKEMAQRLAAWEVMRGQAPTAQQAQQASQLQI